MRRTTAAFAAASGILATTRRTAAKLRPRACRIDSVAIVDATIVAPGSASDRSRGRRRIRALERGTDRRADAAVPEDRNERRFTLGSCRRGRGGAPRSRASQQWSRGHGDHDAEDRDAEQQLLLSLSRCASWASLAMTTLNSPSAVMAAPAMYSARGEPAKARRRQANARNDRPRPSDTTATAWRAASRGRAASRSIQQRDEQRAKRCADR